MAYYSEKPARGLVGKNMLVEPKYGDIFYVSIPGATGHEMDKTRPAVVVSSDKYNRVKNCVTVVFLSASANQCSGEVCRVTVRSTPKKSTAICDQPTTVDKTRLGTWMGRATEHEMMLLAVSLMDVLNIGHAGLQDGQEGNEEVCVGTPAIVPEEKTESSLPQADGSDSMAIRLEAERDTYRALYNELLGRATRHLGAESG